MSISHDFLDDCRRLYRRTLLEEIVPFWIRHGFDRVHGGIGNVIDDAGNPLSFDKYLWSQGRALWTFSALYNRIERRPEWLDFAGHIFRYLETHGRDEQGRWVYRLDADGKVMDGAISLYVDGFVLNGLGEYYLATRDDAARRLALETAENVRHCLRTGNYAVAPYAIPEGLKTHGVRMIFSFFFFNLGKALDRPDFCQEGLLLAHEILRDFYSPQADAILEFVKLDGTPVDSPAGRACVPGHAIEALWFLIAIFEKTAWLHHSTLRTPREPARNAAHSAAGGDTRPTENGRHCRPGALTGRGIPQDDAAMEKTSEKEAIRECCRLIRRHLELAWDAEYGGLRLALDIQGRAPCYWNQADCKPWWVCCESLVATAYAYRHTGEDWCLEWHRRVRDYAFARYPTPAGEWIQWLDRRGNPMPSAALPVKDPFHLPRALIYLVNLSK